MPHGEEGGHSNAQAPGFPGRLTLPVCLSRPQYRKGGPVIAVQVENEYGSFYKDKAYMPYLHQVKIGRAHV